MVSNQIWTACQREYARPWGQADQPEVRADGDPSTLIWMWPQASQPGCLETVLWSVVSRLHRELAGDIENLSVKVGHNEWTKNQRDKSLIQTYIALSNRGNPNLGLGRLWSERPNLIPLDSGEFDPISDFLAQI
jgi:hypothetical protein